MLDSIEMAWTAIKGNKIHSIITIFSIIIGIVSLIIIISVGSESKYSVIKELDLLGGNELGVHLDVETVHDTIKDEEIDLLKETVNGIVGITAQKTIPGKLNTKYKSFNVSIECVTYDYRYFDKNGLEKGKYFSLLEQNNGLLCGVIPYEDALKMFGTVNVVGKTVEIIVGEKKDTYLIEGVQKKQKINNNNLLDNNTVQIIVPMTLANNYYSFENSGYSDIYVIVDEGYNMDIVEKNIFNIICKYHNINKDGIKISNTNDYIDMVNNIIFLVTIILSLLSAISLIVGGLGVTNIMLLNVKLRTNEIGIRKAMGAKNKDILKQFIAESTIITGIGGAIGIFVGILLSKAIGSIIKIFDDVELNVTIPWEGSLIIFIVLLLLGGICGVLPAKHAAKLDPIIAFKQ